MMSIFGSIKSYIKPETHQLNVEYCDAKPGDVVPGKGVFITIWTPRDNKGNIIGSFNVYGDQDLLHHKDGGDLFDFKTAAKQVGPNFNTETSLKTALKNKTYNGALVIPPLELITGTDSKGNRVVEQSLKEVLSLGRFPSIINVDHQYDDGLWSSSQPKGKKNHRYAYFPSHAELYSAKVSKKACTARVYAVHMAPRSFTL